MEDFGNFLSLAEQSLNTKRRRHIIGGVLISFALLFGGLAATVLSIRNEYEEDNDDPYEVIYSEAQ